MAIKTWLKKSKWRIGRFVLLAVLLVAIIVEITLPAARKNKPVKIIVVSKTTDMGIAFWRSIGNGLQAAAQEYEVTVDYRAPETDSETGVETQINLVYQAIAEKPDAIIVAAINADRLTASVRSVQASGIPLVMMDSNISGGTPTGACFVATGNVTAGQKAGEALARILPKGKKVLIVAHVLQANSAIDRDTGVREGLGSNYDILPTIDSGGSEEAAYQLVSAVLAKDPDIAGIVGLNEYATVGAARAIRGAGMTKKIAMVGFDNSSELIVFLEEGLVNATVIQRPFNMGYLAVSRALDLIDGHKIDAFYDTGSILITKENMYQEENEKLLFPFQ